VRRDSKRLSHIFEKLALRKWEACTDPVRIKNPSLSAKRPPFGGLCFAGVAQCTYTVRRDSKRLSHIFEKLALRKWEACTDPVRIKNPSLSAVKLFSGKLGYPRQ
jgi:L-rhamnose mutarotase